MVILRDTEDLLEKHGIISFVAGIFCASRRQKLSTTADLEQLDVDMLRQLIAANPADEDLLVRYARKSAREGRTDDVRAAISTDPAAILQHCPEVATQYLVIHRGSPDIFSADGLIKLGKWCEDSGKYSYALSIYEQWEICHMDNPELETIAYRAAYLWWHEMKNSKRALEKLEIIRRKFPDGKYTGLASELHDQICHPDSNAGRMAA